MAAPKSVYVLDFDGVIVHSVEESSLSAFMTAKRVWPEALDVPRLAEMPVWMMEKMRALRPCIEHGYENVLMIRLVYQEQRVQERSDIGTRALQVSEIAENWLHLRETLLRKWNTSSKYLSEQFAQTRDEWIQRDKAGWMAKNQAYPGIVHALNSCTSPIYMCTTKHARFVRAMLKHFDIHSIPDDHIAGLGDFTTKADYVVQIADQYPDCLIHFVEDRLEPLVATLESMKQREPQFVLSDSSSLVGDTPPLRASSNSNMNMPMKPKYSKLRISLHLAVWGYQTFNDRLQAEKYQPWILLLELDQFCRCIS